MLNSLILHSIHVSCFQSVKITDNEKAEQNVVMHEQENLNTSARTPPSSNNSNCDSNFCELLPMCHKLHHPNIWLRFGKVWLLVRKIQKCQCYSKFRPINYVEVIALGAFAFCDPVAIVLCLPVFRQRVLCQKKKPKKKQNTEINMMSTIAS